MVGIQLLSQLTCEMNQIRNMHKISHSFKIFQSEIVFLLKSVTFAYILLVCLSVCLYRINIETAEPIGPTFLL